MRSTGRGHVVRARLQDVQASGIVMALTDDLVGSSAVQEWNERISFFPFSSIMSITPCLEKEWKRLKAMLSADEK